MATYTQEVNGDVAQTGALEKSGAGTWFSQISDGTTDGSTYVRNNAAESNGTLDMELGNIPTDFASLQTGGDKIEVKMFLAVDAAFNNDSCIVFATLRTSAGTAISDKVQIGSDTVAGARTVTLTGITADLNLVTYRGSGRGAK